MKWIAAVFVLLVSGCSAYTEAQVQLVEQVRRGVDLCRQAQTERSRIVSQYHQMQRQRLDAAFDADVQQQSAMSADWVIEHRKAYALALDALARQQSASAEAEAVAARNLNAIDNALQRILFLQSLQLRLLQWNPADDGSRSLAETTPK